MKGKKETDTQQKMARLQSNENLLHWNLRVPPPIRGLRDNDGLHNPLIRPDFLGVVALGVVSALGVALEVVRALSSHDC